MSQILQINLLKATVLNKDIFIFIAFIFDGLKCLKLGKREKYLKKKKTYKEPMQRKSSNREMQFLCYKNISTMASVGIF